MRIRAGIAVLGALMLVPAGCGEEDQPERAAKPPPPAGARPFPAVPGPLAPGLYRTTKLQPALTLEVPEGWQLLTPEQETYVNLLRGDDPGHGLVVALARVARVADPRRSLTQKAVPPDAALPVPDDLVEWLVDHPRLESEEPQPATLGALPARRVDSVTVRGYASPNCPAKCVFLFSFGPGDFVYLAQGNKARSIFLTDPAEAFGVGIVAPSSAVFEELVDDGERLLDTLEFVDQEQVRR